MRCDKPIAVRFQRNLPVKVNFLRLVTEGLRDSYEMMKRHALRVENVPFLTALMVSLGERIQRTYTLRLIRLNRRSLLQNVAQLVHTFQQTVLHERIHRERYATAIRNG